MRAPVIILSILPIVLLIAWFIYGIHLYTQPSSPLPVEHVLQASTYTTEFGVVSYQHKGNYVITSHRVLAIQKAEYVRLATDGCSLVSLTLDEDGHVSSMMFYGEDKP